MGKLTKEEFDALDSKEQELMLSKIAEVEAQQKKMDDEEEGEKKLSMKEFESTVEGLLEKHIKGMTDVDKKYFMLPGIGKENQDDITPEGKFAKTKRYFHALLGKDTQVLNQMHAEVATKANLSEGTTTAGGFLVPDEFKAEVLRLAPLYGVARQNARYVPMISDVTFIPAATSDNTAHWINEAAAVHSTDPAFKQVTLTINKLGAIPKLTNELLADANVNIISYLAETIAEEFAKAEDTQAFTGTGSPFTGVLSNTGSPITTQALGTTVGSLAYGDLVTATGNIFSNAKGNAKFYFNRGVIAHIRSLVSTTGQPIFGIITNTIGNFPVVDTEVMPGTGDVSGTNYEYGIFGDLRKGLLFGERGSITMKLSEDATVASDNLFEKDMVALRVIERVSMAVALPSAYTQIST